MNKAIAIALLVAGVVLMIVGVNAMDSFASDVSRIFTGSPTDKALWMFVAGVVAAVMGLTLAVRGWKRT